RMISKTSLDLSLQRKISARTTFSLSGKMQQNSSGGGRTYISDDRTYYSFEPRLSWRASPWWTISGSYRYQQSEYTSSNSRWANIWIYSCLLS
ncbi:MAG: hypothetical protein P8Z39_08200, partial [Gammaproteobacteria bacterium]